MLNLSRTQMQEGGTQITTSSGAVTGSTITFEEAFTWPPAMLITPPKGAEGTYAAENITTTSFNVSVTGETAENFDNDTFWLQWVAVAHL